MLDVQARLIVDGRVPDGRVRRFLSGFLRFDPAHPGLKSGLFYFKLLLLDAVLLMYVIGRCATLALGLAGVGGA